MFGKPMDFAEPSGRLDAFWGMDHQSDVSETLADLKRKRAEFNRKIFNEEVRLFATLYRQRCIVAFVRDTISGATHVHFERYDTLDISDVIFRDVCARMILNKVRFAFAGRIKFEVNFEQLVSNDIQTQITLASDNEETYKHFVGIHCVLRGYAKNWFEHQNTINVFIKELKTKESNERIYYRCMFYQTIGRQLTLPKDIRRLIWNLIVQ